MSPALLHRHSPLTDRSRSSSDENPLLPLPPNRLVADWIAVYGNVVMSDASRPINITHCPRTAVVNSKLEIKYWSIGIVYFAFLSNKLYFLYSKIGRANKL